jgi:hypothetical protein
MKRLASLSLILALVATALLVAGAQGATWVLKTTPLPSGGKEGTLRGVSCVSNFCAAVGDFWQGEQWGASGDELGEAGEWKSAKVVANEEPGGKNGDLRSVSCWEVEECRAAGAYGTSKGVGTPLVETRLEGKAKWEQQTAGKFVGTAPEFRGISCYKGGTFCVAVGQVVKPGSLEAALAQEWNSANWLALGPVENPGNKGHGHLTSVACVSKTVCIAAGGWGREVAGKEVIQAGSETYNKTAETWTAIEAEEPAKVENADFYSIACTSATSCIAVGNWKEEKGATPTRILADVWNGTKWTVSLSSGPALVNEGTLRGVSCPSAEECEAVGGYINATTLKEEPLAYIWKGKKWTQQTAATPAGATKSALEAVSCTGAEVCQATGTESTSLLKFFPFGETL